MKSNAQFEQSHKILVINPGSTSTKVAIFSGRKIDCAQTIEHSSAILSTCTIIVEQFAFRIESIKTFLSIYCSRARDINAIASRGGLLRPLKSGTYIVTDKMCEDLKIAKYGEHASNLGALLASELKDTYKVQAFIVDPINLDEFEEQSKISGFPGIERKSRIHTLNIKSVAKQYVEETGRNIEDTRFVVAHLGGGISVCAMVGGRVIDSTDALLGEGPFSLERAGTLPLSGLIELCFDKGLTRNDVTSLLSSKSGFKGSFGLDRLPEIYKSIDAGNYRVEVMLQALIRQVVKWIGGMAALLKTEPDAIILTGGMVNSPRLVEAIVGYVGHLGRVKVYPGEHEMEALAEGVLRVLNKEEEALEY